MKHLFTFLACTLFASLIQAEPLAVIHDASATCFSGVDRGSACLTGRLDFPKGDDLVALCPGGEQHCWDGVPKIKKFSEVLPTELIDGCNNPATVRPTALPNPWTDAADPCRIWKPWSASTFAVAPPFGKGTATLSWVAPLANVDDTPLTNLKGFRVVYGASATALAQTIDIPTSTATSYTVQNLTPGTWFFALKAYTTDGTESGLSGVVSKVIPVPPASTTPKPPGSVTVASVVAYDLSKVTANKPKLVAFGTVLEGAPYLPFTVEDETGVYQLIQGSKAKVKPTTGTAIPYTVFVKL